MTMKRYYPSGYRKKKRQESVQRLVIYVVLAILVAGGAVVAGWGVVKMFKPGTPDQGTVELANAQAALEQREHEQEADLNPAPVTDVPSGEIAPDTVPAQPESKPILLADIKEFETSFPEIGVSLLSLAEGGAFADVSTTTPPAENTASADSQPVPVEPEDDADQPPQTEPVRPGPPVSRDAGESGSGSDLSRDSDSHGETGSNNSSGSQTGNSGSNAGGAGDSASSGSAGNTDAGATGSSGGTSGKYVYSVYAGSWDDKGNATRKLDELAGVGYAAQIIEAEFAGKKTFRILVKSKIDDYEKAKEIQSDLKTKGFSEAVVYKDKA
jgi:uncharacterized membrane protein YgcG